MYSMYIQPKSLMTLRYQVAVKDGKFNWQPLNIGLSLGGYMDTQIGTDILRNPESSKLYPDAYPYSPPYHTLSGKGIGYIGSLPLER